MRVFNYTWFFRYNVFHFGEYMKLVDVFDIFPLKYDIVHSIKVIYQHKMTNELIAINNMISL